MFGGPLGIDRKVFSISDVIAAEILVNWDDWLI